MYPFGQIDNEIEKLSRDFAENRLTRREFDKQMKILQQRKADELEFFKRHPPEEYGQDGILWA